MRVYTHLSYTSTDARIQTSLNVCAYTAYMSSVSLCLKHLWSVSAITRKRLGRRATPPATRRRPQPSSGLREAIPLKCHWRCARPLAEREKMSLRGRIVHVSLRPCTHSTEQTRSGWTGITWLWFVYAHMCAHTTRSYTRIYMRIQTMTNETVICARIRTVTDHLWDVVHPAYPSRLTSCVSTKDITRIRTTS